MATAAAPTKTSIEILRAIYGCGYRLTVRTRIEVHDHKLQVRGDDPIPPHLAEEIRAHRDELLAAACVIDPPVSWLRVLVERCRSGREMEVRREGWRGPYRIRLAMVAANVAAFIGLHPNEDGPLLERIIEEALR
jgi:hypothetical protein